MKFIELTVHTTTEASEIIADIMWNYTNYGVTICDVNDIIALQKSKDTMYWDYMDDDLTAAQPKDVLVKCYIAQDIAEKTVGEIMRDVADAKEMSGGFILVYGGIEENCTIRALFDAERDELSDKVHGLLFGQVEMKHPCY